MGGVNGRVVLVEPDAALVELLVVALSLRGYAVMVAEGLEEAADLASGQECRAVLVAQEALGPDSGQGLLRALAADRPVVVMGAPTVLNVTEAILLGATDVVLKGAGMDAWLPLQVESIIQRQQARAQTGTTSIGSAWLAHISHDLRTPLTTILGFSGLLLEKSIGPLNPDQEAQLRLMQKAAQQLLVNINGVLELARLDAGGATAPRIPVDVVALVREVADSAQAALPGGPRIVVSNEHAGIIVQSDPGRLRQAALNVVGHAAAAHQPKQITLLARSAERGAEIEVSDDGKAPPVDALHSMFDRTRSPQRGSMGVGLALAQQLVLSLGGTLQATALQPRGARFHLRIPALPALPS